MNPGTRVQFNEFGLVGGRVFVGYLIARWGISALVQVGARTMQTTYDSLKEMN